MRPPTMRWILASAMLLSLAGAVVGVGLPGTGDIASFQLLRLDPTDPEERETATPAPVLAAPPTPAPPLVFSGLSLPLREWVRVSDRHGAIRRGGVVHSGIDLVLTGHLSSSNVYAACPGVVTPETYGPSYGVNLIIDCGDGWTTVYAHLGDAFVLPGDRVERETVLGYSGLTGYTSGEHLHFEVRRHGVAVNPEHYLDFGIPPGAPLAEDDSLAEDPADRTTPPPAPVNPIAAAAGEANGEQGASGTATATPAAGP